ncbi:helitron helicase-like domain-containing protein [Artemisia annua]|uniref:Helitron helicase-like domain-containing protein n=1 Tax=Artemisia annua TaxID=35608 RepID=A0A2U1PAR2_ARTAN|nr:helitron helicase-like domain-containing protein [Artemisia annua]
MYDVSFPRKKFQDFCFLHRYNVQKKPTQNLNTEEEKIAEKKKYKETKKEKEEKNTITHDPGSSSRLTSIGEHVVSDLYRGQTYETHASDSVHSIIYMETITLLNKIPTNGDDLDKDRHQHIFLWAVVLKFANIAKLFSELDDSINRGRGPYVFKVSGKIYHWIGSMCPELNKEPKFLQLYIYDTTNEVKNRLDHFNKSETRLRRDIFENLIQVLDNHNELVKLFRTARDKMEGVDVPNFKVKLFGVVGSRQYDLPAGDSIGAIVFEGGPDVGTNYDVIIEKRGGNHNA